jgi:ribonuclease HIII
MKLDIVARLRENALLWDEIEMEQFDDKSESAILLRQAAREIELLRNQVNNYKHLLGIDESGNGDAVSS